MIRHYHMDHVIGPPFRHVAADTIGAQGMKRSRMRAGGRCALQRSGVAAFANAVIVRGCRCAPRDIVWIVTRSAAKSAFALQKALRLAQPVGALGDLEAVAHPALAVELKTEIPQRLSRHVGKRGLIKARDRVREIQTGGLEVALKTYFDFPRRIQAFRVHDGSSD